MRLAVRRWQIISIVLVFVLVFFWSAVAADNSARGIYAGSTKAEALQSFPPFARLIYSAEPYHLNEYDPTAPAVTRHLYGFLTVPEDDGTIFTTFVLPGSPAAEAGLAAGDVIYAIDGTRLTPDNTVKLDRQIGAEETVQLSIWHSGDTRTISMTKADVQTPAAYVYVGGQAVDSRYTAGPGGQPLAFKSLNELQAFAQKIASHPSQFSVDTAPTAPLVFATFWALFDAIVVIVLVGWIPPVFARPHGWLRASVGLALSMFAVPALFAVLIIWLSNSSETIKMFTDFGVHRYGGFGIDFANALDALFRALVWLFLLGCTNAVLMMLAIARGRDSSLMHSLME